MNAHTGTLSLPIWAKFFSLLMICALLSSPLILVPSGSVQASSLAQNRDRVDGYCECVTYIVYRLFQRTLTGSWGKASEMDNKYYWSPEHLKDSKLSPTGLAREPKADAKAGDVIIFGGGATFQVYLTSSTVRYDPVKKMFVANPGYIPVVLGTAGHIGIVRKATYDGKIGGWWIQMESSNWPQDWGKWDTNRQFSNNRDGTASFYCNQVSTQQQIFVPNYSNIHFWRVKP
jgi:hypothetical protein